MTTTESTNLKRVVREKYAALALGTDAGDGCCGSACGPDLPTDFIGEAYTQVEGYVADADLHLGCGIPTDHAALQPGETALDLGSGAGIDAFVARTFVGETGRVLGVDMTPEMVAKARQNADKLGFTNVEFRLGEIESLPVETGAVDVILSNCVLNLVPEKEAAFAEMCRVLRPGGRFCISDVVTRGDLSDEVRRSAELYAGCVSGALGEGDYLNLLREAGFANVRVATEKLLRAPGVDAGVLVSITVLGTKPA